MAYCTRCRQVMEPTAAVCPACGNDFADSAVPPPGPSTRGGRWHFWVLLAGTVLFLIRLRGSTGEVVWRSFPPDDGAVRNTARVLEGVRTLGVYAAFVAVLFGHRYMRSRREGQ